MTKKTYIGVDPGTKGFIAILTDGQFTTMSLSDNTPQAVMAFLKTTKENSESLHCVIEDVHAIFGASAKSTFNFGYQKGYIVGIVQCLSIPYTLVPSKDWQSTIWATSDKVYKAGTGQKRKIETKRTSLNAVVRIFPNEDLRRTEKCTSPDDNKVDAMLMAEYARRMNL